MKNTIMYYYDFDNPIIYKWNKRIYVKYNNEKYLFQPVYLEQELAEIYSLMNRNDQYYRIIKNKFNSLITIYQGQKYVLLRLNEVRSGDYEREIFNHIYIPPTSKYIIDRSNWYFLWSKKNDYFEYQLSHISGKYPLIDESIDYYIGLAETAISYIKYNSPDNTKNNYDDLTVCHRRINKDSIFNPLNVVVDHKERDIAEYLKYLFFNRENTEDKIKYIINNYKGNIFGYYRIYARLLYPSYYFDIYDGIINEQIPEEELRKIIERVNEYEQYLQKIFDIMYTKSGIKKVEWIQKK